MVATSTVAEGMNFPAEVVLISGDSRFDAGEGKLREADALIHSETSCNWFLQPHYLLADT